ncbi:type 1 glutamine amidotransferase [Segetibacter koreensis]|uniref:type 1 glutamine amidotransferase n=1 Tax=Segetibacter koreensis TaxID=398037 RepID=UPI00037C38C7|nr:homoserine O-succinyltransferase [Segetibacter koreensis]
MNWNEKNKYKIAILDLNDGFENQGMRCLRDITKKWSEENDYSITVEEFNVREKHEVPGTDFDIYISSGGPGSPLDSKETEWEKHYFKWLQKIEKWNNDESNFQKKHVFFICHSFQLVCRHYNVANVNKRKSTSFGVFPIHLMQDGSEETVFEGLQNPFYAVDSRDYQVTAPDHEKIREMGGKILALEKERPHVPFERAIMAMRFNNYFIGTQFHPEADACGMTLHLLKEDKKKIVIENHGEEKWKSMIEHLNDPDKIVLTYNHVLPNFLNHAVSNLVAA